MPFTSSHPAIVLPLKKLFPKYVSLSGLMAGAMSPDLIYFLEMNTVNRGLSHSWSGLFTVCLPLGILFCFAFHWLVKKELIYSLPLKMSRHLSGLAESEWSIVSLKDALILITSVLIGALSHFFWDSFTHLTGETVSIFPVLKNDFTLLGFTIPLYHLLQHLSTLFGMIGILVWFTFKSNLPPRARKFQNRTIQAKIIFWIKSFVISFVFAFLILNLYRYYFPDRVVSETAIFGLAGWAGFFYLTALTTIVNKLKFFLKKSNKTVGSEYN